ncbi:MAG TPA: L-lactate dehydrogenase, partial [Arachnia sp.]|nr:L-lactate dehydrogenase [Arachnia sp.]
ATRIIESVLRDERRVLPVSRMLEGWHGISGVCMAVPTVVGRDGAGTQLELPVSDEELSRLRTSAEHIRAMSEGLGF